MIRDIEFAIQELERFKDGLLVALEHGASMMSFDDVKDRVKSGRFNVWTDSAGICVTEVINTPTRKLLNTILGAGELASVKALQESIEAAAPELGCAVVTIIGRKGWGKVFSGYKEAATLYMKEL